MKLRSLQIQSNLLAKVQLNFAEFFQCVNTCSPRPRKKKLSLQVLSLRRPNVQDKVRHLGVQHEGGEPAAFEGGRLLGGDQQGVAAHL